MRHLRQRTPARPGVSPRDAVGETRQQQACERFAARRCTWWADGPRTSSHAPRNDAWRDPTSKCNYPAPRSKQAQPSLALHCKQRLRVSLHVATNGTRPRSMRTGYSRNLPIFHRSILRVFAHVRTHRHHAKDAQRNAWSEVRLRARRFIRTPSRSHPARKTAYFGE